MNNDIRTQKLSDVTTRLANLLLADGVSPAVVKLVAEGMNLLDAEYAVGFTHGYFLARQPLAKRRS